MPPLQSRGPARCARRLYRSVQSKDVGLKGDAVNHTNNFHNPLGAVMDFVHGLHYFRHYLATL